MQQIPITELKAHVSEIVNQVALGQTIAITRHGKTVATLNPIVTKPRRSSEEVIAEFRAFRKKVGPVPTEDIISSIHEGHKY